MTAPTAQAAAPLKAHPFFAGLPETALWHLGRTAEPLTLQPDEYLFREGEDRALFAVIVSGGIAIEQANAGQNVQVAALGPGEVLGEGLLLEETRHGTTARAHQITELLVIRKKPLLKLLKDQPALYAALVARAAKIINQRIKKSNATLVSGRQTVSSFSMAGISRRERDLLGELDVPADALYGIQTLRAIDNFPITGVTMSLFPAFIRAFAQVKEAAALANHELGALDDERFGAIVGACREIRQGLHHEHFRVDMIQGGAGTSANMNANEVIANRALELLGSPRGDYKRLSPNSHVNLSQSTNDVYPTAMRLALHAMVDDYKASLHALAEAFLAKGKEFSGLLKMGRTQLQDAVPMTLGQEFRAFGITLLEEVDRLTEAQGLLREISMGATAVGTGIATPKGYTESVRRHLSELSGLSLVTAPDLVEATADVGAFVHVSGVLRRSAVKLSKICNDLRLLSSGPRAGLDEINLPPMQPGSSLMPGKVNPVIPEAVNQVCFDVIGGDVTVAMAAESGQLQLNVFEPIIAFRLMRNLTTLIAGSRILREKCVVGITANAEKMRLQVEQSIGVITALVPALGYEVAERIAGEAARTGRGVYELVIAEGLMEKGQLDALLSPAAMTGEG
jgi:aspartate ammonia-lyase